MIVQKIYAGLNFVSRNLLDSGARGAFMGITLGETTKLLDNMTANYSQWHSKQAPTSKKVNFVEEVFTLSDKLDALMNMVIIVRMLMLILMISHYLVGLRKIIMLLM